jgi:hypothetical protein
MNIKSLVMPLCLALFLPLALWAQEPERFSKVNKEDLEMTSYPADTSAVAVILFDKGKLDFDFNDSESYLFERHRRIKILKRPGFDYGDITLSYYTKGSGEKINQLKAMVHNPDGSTTKLSRSDFFEEEYNEYWTRIKFSFPDLQAGSIIEYQYTLNSPYLSSLPDWFFQHDIPVRWSEYHVEIPERYNYVAITQGRELDVSEITEYRKNYAIAITRTANASRRGNLELGVHRYQLIMKDVPALKEERYITNMNDYRSRLRFQLQSTANDRVVEPYMSTWNQISEELMEDESFGGQLERKRNFNKINEALAPALAQAKSQTEKAQLIYDHINKNIEWTGEYRYTAKENLSDIYEKKQGTSGELNLMLLGMLKSEGINSAPVLISTRDNGKMIELYPILSQFNHLMVVADLDGKQVFLDAGNPCRPMGMPRAEALNGYRAVLLDPVQATWIDLPVLASKSVQMATVSMDEDGLIKGTMTEMKKGYYAVDLRNALEVVKAETLFEKRYAASIPEIEIGEVDVAKDSDMSTAFKSTVDFTIPNQAMVNGDFIYFTPILNKWYDENPFKLEKREYPVDFNYPMSRRYILSMELPEGYIIEEQPENLNLVLPNKGAAFTYSIRQLGNKVTLNCNLTINQIQFQPAEYLALKKFFDLIVEKQNEQLVLKYSED